MNTIHLFKIFYSANIHLFEIFYKNLIEKCIGNAISLEIQAKFQKCRSRNAILANG